MAHSGLGLEMRWFEFSYCVYIFQMGAAW